MEKIDRWFYIFYITMINLNIILAIKFQKIECITIAIWVVNTTIMFHLYRKADKFGDVRVENRDNFIKTLLKQNNIYRTRLDTQYNFESEIRAIRDKAKVMDYYTLNNVIDDLNETLEEIEEKNESI